jgi:hypothetical protein
MADETERAAYARGAADIAVVTAGALHPALGIGAGLLKAFGDVITARRDFQARNVAALSEAIIELTGLSPEEFHAWTAHSDDRRLLVVRAIEVATEATFQRKVLWVARLVAEGIRNHEKLDINGLILKAIQPLDAVHVQMLLVMMHEQPPPTVDGEIITDGGWSLGQLKDRFALVSAGFLETGGLDANTGTVWIPGEFAHISIEKLERIVGPN